MKRAFPYLVAALAAALCLVAELPAQDKNSAQVEFRDLPTAFELLPAREPERWNFGFRLYDAASAALLWSDPIVQRSALKGEDVGDKEVTALYVCCNTKGFHVLVYCAMKGGLKESIGKGKTIGNGLECYFLPGDSDSAAIHHWYQFVVQPEQVRAPGVFPWLVEDRNFRTIRDWLQVKVGFVSNGLVYDLYVPWDPLFDRLPFGDGKKDNFWRLGVMRWGRPAQTWGGVVQAQDTCGYIRWPEFTQAQKAAIRKHLLISAFGVYTDLRGRSDFTPRGLPVERTEPYKVAEMAKYPHSLKNYCEDFGFRRAWLDKAIENRDLLGETIVKFETLPEAEQDAFYAKASDMLFNFQYDADQAYDEYLKQTSLFKR